MGCGASTPSDQAHGAAVEAGDELDQQLENLEQEAPGQEDTVLRWLDKALCSTGPGPVDVQKLEVAVPGPVLQAIALSPALKAVVGLVQTGVRTLPFGEPLAAALGWMYSHGVKAAKVSRNAKQLLDVVNTVHRALAKAALTRTTYEPDVKTAIGQLAACVVAAGKLFSEYCQRHVLLRLMQDDMERFKALDKRLHSAMGQVAFITAMQLHSGQYVKDEGGKLRAGVCKAAGMAEGQAKEALEQLSQSKEGRNTLHALLREHLGQHGSMVEQLLAKELDELTQAVTVVQADIAGIHVTLLQLQQRNEEASKKGPEGLAPFLQAWWNKQGWQVKKSVKSEVFHNKLMTWLKENGSDTLTAYDEAMVEEGVLVKVEVVGEGATVFLRLVVMRLLDEDHDGQVSRSELYRLQVLAGELAKRPDVLHATPDSLLDLLNVVFMGFDRSQLQQSVGPVATNNSELVAKVQADLKMSDTISSYKIASMLDEYVQGSRLWMYKAVDDWLESATEGADDASRMLLLLAGAGMGKSVFSAVMHTKLAVRTNRSEGELVVVGQARASGKVAILCLAHQLASVLPGMASQLEGVIKEHGDAGSLSMADTCDKYLMQPLLALSAPDQPPMPGVLLLLDAMDEADDGTGRGWQAVASLLSREFLKLPPSVRVLVTGRPEVGDKFSAWPSPVTIEPKADDNMADMRIVMRARLDSRKVLSVSEDLDAATQVMLDKSKGQFIYIKFAFEALAARLSWTLTDLRDPNLLPAGLAGAFQLALGTLQAALGREKPDLLRLLRQGVLPVLVAARDPVTAVQLAWLVGAGEQQVEELLGYAANLFPRRAAGADGQLRVFPYHKTVLDWLTAKVVAGEGGQPRVVAYNTPELDWLAAADVPGEQLRVDPAVGHALCAAACHAVAMTLPLSDPRAPRSKERPVPDDKQLYALRHVLPHLREARDGVRVNSLVMQLGFWEWVHATGMGPAAVRDLAQLKQDAPAGTTDQVTDVLRWLRNCSAYLAKHPSGTLQLACDAPHTSLVAKHAATLPLQPLATMLTKEDNWPAFLSTLQGSCGLVRSVAISPDGKTIVSGSTDNAIRVWDLESGECKSTLQGHTSEVTSVTISPDGRAIVSGSEDNTIRVWDLESGECKSTLQGHTDYVYTGKVTSVAISQDGRTIVSGSNENTIRVWDLESGECKSTLQGHTKEVTSVAISPDSKIIMSGSQDLTIRVWDLESGKCKSTLHGHTMEVTSVTISPDGKTIMSGSRDETIRLWDLESSECKSTLQGHTGKVTSMAISPDGKAIISGSCDQTIRMWDVESGECKSTLQGHTDLVYSVAIGPDGKTIVSGAGDQTIRVWDLESGECKSTVEGHTDCVFCVAISADGKTIASCSCDKTIRVWDLESGECKSTLQGHTDMVVSVAISADGKTIVSGSCDETIRVWDLESGECKNTLQGHSEMVNSVAISPDGKTSVSGSRDTTIRVWDLESGECKSTLQGHTSEVTSVAFSPDGKTIISGSIDKTIRVWDLESGECKSILQVPTSWVNSVAISADGKTIVSGSDDKTIRAWDLETGKQLSDLTPEQAAQAWSRGDDQVLVLSDECAEFVDVVQAGPAAHTLATVYVAPPFLLQDIWPCSSMKTKRLAFRSENHVLVYQLNF